jgi:hypothetical protein
MGPRFHDAEKAAYAAVTNSVRLKTTATEAMPRPPWWLIVELAHRTYALPQPFFTYASKPRLLSGDTHGGASWATVSSLHLKHCHAASGRWMHYNVK